MQERKRKGSSSAAFPRGFARGRQNSDPRVHVPTADLFTASPAWVGLGASINGGPAGEDGSGQSTARSEFAADEAPLRANGFDDIAENFVHRVFVEDPQAAVGEEIHFQGLQLEAILL